MLAMSAKLLPPWYVQALLVVLVCVFPNVPALWLVGQCVALKMAMELELDCQQFYQTKRAKAELQKRAEAGEQKLAKERKLAADVAEK